MKALFGFLFAAYCLPSLASEVLVVQKVTREESGDILITRELAFALGNELQETFALRSVVWSLTDPTFRQAIYDNLVTGDHETPTLPLALEAGKKLGATFVAWIENSKTSEGLKSTLSLYKVGTARPVYKRELSLVAQINENNDPDSVGRSTARTWALELATGALKTYIKTNPGSEPDGGTTTTAPIPTYTPEPPTLTVVDEPSLFAKVDEQLKVGHPNAALKLLYAAVDAAPRSIPIRIRLIELLQQLGYDAEALSEAQRTLIFAPSTPQLRLILINGLIASGDLARAQSEINEGLARTPEDPIVLEAAGNLALAQGNASRARFYYLPCLAKAPNDRVRFSLAIAMAAEGDNAEAVRTLSEITNKDLLTVGSFHRLSQKCVQMIGKDLAETIRLVRTAPDRATLLIGATKLLKATESLVALLEQISPTSDPALHSGLLLAHKLLWQAAGETLDFARAAEEDLGSAAQISLSDAMMRFEKLAEPK